MKYHVEKSIKINASMDVVKKHIEDFALWNAWSPWTMADKDCEIEVSGNPGQPRHSMSWNSDIIGSGTNTLVSSDDRGYHYDLAFLSPMKSKAKTSLLLEEKGGGVMVTWTMDGKLPFFLFFMAAMMKNWIGMDYDRGLRMLKSVAETGTVPATTTNRGIQDFNGFSYVGIERTVHFDDLPKAMSKDFDTLIEEVVMKRQKGAKHWVTLYPKMNMKTMNMTYIAAVSDEDLEGQEFDDRFVRGTLSSTKALEIKHEGSYEFLGNAWSMGMTYLRAKKIKQIWQPFEYYWNSPKETAPEDLKTSIYFPVKH